MYSFNKHVSKPTLLSGLWRWLCTKEMKSLSWSGFPSGIEEMVIGQMLKLAHVLETIKQRTGCCCGAEEMLTGGSSNRY